MFPLLRFFVTLIIVLLVAHFVPGIVIDNRLEIIGFAIVLSLVNAFIRPFIIILTIPITVITLGLFTLVIDVFIFWLGALLSYGVHLQSIETVFIAGLLIWLAGLLSNLLLWRQGE